MHIFTVCVDTTMSLIKFKMGFLISYSLRKTMNIFLNDSFSSLFQTFCWTFFDYVGKFLTTLEFIENL